MINLDTLIAAQVEVTRFQAALDAVREAERKRYKAAEKEERAKYTATPSPKISWEKWLQIGAYSGGPETAALRRASMDLTRALADLRR